MSAPFVDDPDFRLYVGDALETLRTLPDGSVDCCVTSPPYWGLRDYGTGSWEGGDEGCDHSRQSDISRASSGLDGATATQGGAIAWRDVCGRCGARRVDRQLGLEDTPDAYVAAMVGVFREVRRVLSDSGTLWLNLGDSYAADRSYQVAQTRNPNHDFGKSNATKVPLGLKAKDLVGIPWRVAFALQADGWYLRSDIIWSKPNPMPESVRDRPTKAHEYVFLLSKSPRYWFDAAAIKEASVSETPSGNGYARPEQVSRGGRGQANGWTLADGEQGRNARSVWEIATEPYPEAHFATFPTELARRCILAGCPQGGTVLDPFLGSGTTALVARRHGRNTIGIELNEAYATLAAKRLQQLSLLAPAAVAGADSSSRAPGGSVTEEAQ